MNRNGKPPKPGEDVRMAFCAEISECRTWLILTLSPTIVMSVGSERSISSPSGRYTLLISLLRLEVKDVLMHQPAAGVIRI